MKHFVLLADCSSIRAKASTRSICPLRSHTVPMIRIAISSCETPSSLRALCARSAGKRVSESFAIKPVVNRDEVMMSVQGQAAFSCRVRDEDHFVRIVETPQRARGDFRPEVIEISLPVFAFARVPD